MKNQKLLSCLIFLCLLAVESCTNSSILVPNPKGTRNKTDEDKTKSESAIPAPKRRSFKSVPRTKDAVESAFVQKDSTAPKFKSEIVKGNENSIPLDAVSLRHPPYQVMTNVVRVAVKQNCTSATFYSVGVITIRSGNNATLSFRGRFTVATQKNAKILIVSAVGEDEIFMPCTVVSTSPYNFIEFEDKSYRGTFVIAGERQGTFACINVLAVEDYLRGVVPLEIGKRTEQYIEALKAQAIAARTYAYKRMLTQGSQSFDLLSSVSDQVYGGADAEYRESDLAIRLTKDLIMTYGDSLVNAYYHSTCGGRTADIRDVWDRTSCPYLVSINDLDSLGRPYCKDSPQMSWSESWSSSQLSSILSKTFFASYPQSRFSGPIKQLTVSERFSCGRVKFCAISTSTGNFLCGGDKARFVIRRPNGKDILRSSKFTIESCERGQIRISGSGYGHGVGMCQFGTLGRAIAGQQFEQILKSYYTGIQISTAFPLLSSSFQ